MKFDISKLPAVRAQLERDAAAAKPAPAAPPAPQEFARAPVAGGAQSAPTRPGAAR